MPKSYSTADAKARLSEILRGVRERGERALITYHGEAVAELRPIEEEAEVELARRLERLARMGAVVPSERRGELEPLERREGALGRFLAGRGE